MKKITKKGFDMLAKASPLLIGGCLLGLQSSVFALGLGEISLKSHLNEPLRAEVALISADTLSEHEIKASLAKQAAFETAGVEYYFFLNQLKFKPVFRKNGEVILEVSTKSAVKEPFLDFLVEVRWPNGRIQREYTILLDPPVFSEDPIAASTATTPTSSSQITSVQAPADKTSSYEVPSYSVSGTVGEYLVKSGDSLWRVARKKTGNTSFSMQQRMVAIYAANPDAFMKNNMNRLKRGVVLQIPDEQSIGSISQQQALLEIASQNQQFSGRGAGSRPSAVVDTADYSSGSSSVESSTPTSSDRLKLASPSTSADDAAAVAALESEAVTTLSETVTTLEEENKSLADRLAKTERLLALKNAELSALQEPSTTTSEPVTELESINELEQDEGVVEDLSDSEDVDDRATVDTETTEDTAGTQDTVSEELVSQDTSTNEDTTVAEDSALTTTPESIKTPPVTPDVTKPVVQESFMDKIMAMGSTTLIAIGSGVVVVFFIIFFWIRRRGMSEESYQTSLSVPVNEGLNEEELPEVADDIFAAELDEEDEEDYIPESDIDDLEAEPTEEEVADPLGETDVYIAYGKYDQAIKLLQDAVDQDPERVDLRLKLMECLAETQSLSDFKAQKEALAEVSTDSSVAEQVKELEQKAWPQESDDLDSIPSTEDIFGDLSFDGDTEEDELVFPEEDEGVDDSSEATLDLDALDDALDLHGEEEETEEEILDFDLDIDEAADDEVSLEEELLDTETSVQTDEISEDVGATFEEDLDESIEEEAEYISVDELDSQLDESTEIDDGALELGDVDEASTKLDLARAYIDMEDFDGAREILQEVLTEGNEEQVTEANELMSQLD